MAGLRQAQPHTQPCRALMGHDETPLGAQQASQNHPKSCLCRGGFPARVWLGFGSLGFSSGTSGLPGAHSASLVLWFSPPLPAPAPKFAPFWQELDGESEETAPPVTAGMNEGLAGVADGAQAVWFGVFWLNVLAPGAGGLRGAAQGSVQSPLHFGLFPGVWQ